MNHSWSFGKKIGAGFAVIVLLGVIVGAVGIYALGAVVEAKDHVINVNATNRIDAEKLVASGEKKRAAIRAYLMTKNKEYLAELQKDRQEFDATVARLRPRVYTDEGKKIIDDIERAEREVRADVDRAQAQRETNIPVDVVVKAYEAEAVPKREVLDHHIAAFTALEQSLMERGMRAASGLASSAILTVIAITLVAVLAAVILALLLTRTLGRQIVEIVGRVRSSAVELQSAANQQATGSKEQSTAMTEITTTINELLATSRQIAESAQRVAQIAEDAVRTARTGDGTVDKAHESIAAIRRQVDTIVGHMLDLGKKSQQIGTVLDIVTELAEQTNILAINATIEAAGAGETGKRFAVVADEIRKLADRVGSSAKEIRSLIEDVRGAVNTTVMATETGSKAVDTGSKQFGDVAEAFKQIVGLVSTTTEATREIVLSTKQQATAVEQVNVAMGDVSQAAHETEVSASQTLQTASQFATMSKDLMRIVQSKATARE